MPRPECICDAISSSHGAFVVRMRVELNAISKTYDGSTFAVRDVDLTIPSGSILGLIGPNGAGKSTALRMVATVMEPTGEIGRASCRERV